MYENVEELLHNEHDHGIMTLMDRLNFLINDNIHSTDSISSDLIDLEFLNDIKNITEHENIRMYFGKTLRDLKLVVLDNSCREHEIFIKYQHQKKLHITSLNLPHSALQDREYGSLYEILVAFKKHVESISSYLSELEKIDKFCTIMEPVTPSFKDDYRRIFIDERTWLHVEVSMDGLAKNIYLVGQSELWSNKLQTGLLAWDHDMDIVENIMTIFDFVNFPTTSGNPEEDQLNEKAPAKDNMCGICLCSKLSDYPGMPLPLCQNTACGVYFHRSCLYQWLIACAGGRPPAFGVSIGSCPACFSSITCRDKDD